MNILITGAKGFIGRNLVAELNNIKEGKAKGYGLSADLNVFEYDMETDPSLLDGFCRDADFLAALSDTKVISVAGNCDGLAAKAAVDEFIKAADKKIWLTHGHSCRVKYGTGELINQAQQYGVDVVIYGHTHIADNRQQDNLLILNPGSIGRPYGNKPSFLLMTINDKKITVKLMEIL